MDCVKGLTVRRKGRAVGGVTGGDVPAMNSSGGDGDGDGAAGGGGVDGGGTGSPGGGEVRSMAPVTSSMGKRSFEGR